MTARLCDWCRDPLSPTARRDAKTCSQSCRQARHRFRRHLVVATHAEQPLRLAYGDPPYPGLARRYYGNEPDFGGEVDHAELLSRLQGFDGWALSTSTEALPMVLSLLAGVDGFRVAAWFRGPRSVRSARPLSAWEPVIYMPARRVVSSSPAVDALVYGAKPRTTEPRRVVGQKPAAFAFWLFGLMGARRGDSLDDLFPGSGTIGRAWSVFSEPVAQPSR